MHEHTGESRLILPTPEEAKLALIDWSVEADADLRAQVLDIVATAKAKTRKAAPWAAGGALLMGLLMGRNRKRRPGRRAARSPAHGGKLGTILRLAIDFAPLIMSLMRKQR